MPASRPCCALRSSPPKRSSRPPSSPREWFPASLLYRRSSSSAMRATKRGTCGVVGKAGVVFALLRSARHSECTHLASHLLGPRPHPRCLFGCIVSTIAHQQLLVSGKRGVGAGRDGAARNTGEGVRKATRGRGLLCCRLQLHGRHLKSDLSCVLLMRRGRPQALLPVLQPETACARGSTEALWQFETDLCHFRDVPGCLAALEGHGGHSKGAAAACFACCGCPAAMGSHIDQSSHNQHPGPCCRRAPHSWARPSNASANPPPACTPP